MEETMKIALWIAHILIGLIFLMAGSFKGFAPEAQLLEQAANGMPWLTKDTVLLARIAGVSEFIGALGLFLPIFIHKLPAKLIGFAAVGLSTVMVCAMIFHITRGEMDGAVANVVIGSIAGFVAWGRLVRLPLRA